MITEIPDSWRNNENPLAQHFDKFRCRDCANILTEDEIDNDNDKLCDRCQRERYED